MENQVKVLGVTDRDVAQLKSSLERVRAGQKFLERMKEEGISCEGQIEGCANAILEANILLNAIGDGVK